MIISGGTESDFASIQLATRKGRFIKNERRLEKAPAARREAVRIWTQKYPEVHPRSATAVYNCMGLVFASRRCWIDIDCLYMILSDDEYRKLSALSEIEIGDIVIYCRNGAKRVSHIAVVVEVIPNIETASFRTRVMSQWGADGEYIHKIDEVPEELYGVPSEFWTDRKTE